MRLCLARLYLSIHETKRTMGQSWSIILNSHDSSGTRSDGGDASASAGRCWTASQRPGGGGRWPEGRYDPWMPQNHGELI